MAWTMGDKELAALLQGSALPANAVAQEVAAALLRSAARQAIISAAADAVAQLSCGNHHPALPFLLDTNASTTKDTTTTAAGGIDKNSDPPPEPGPDPYP